MRERSEQVHRTDLRHKLFTLPLGALIFEEPEVLCVPLLRSLHLRDHTRRVVRAQFLVAHAPGPGAHAPAAGLQAYGLEAGLVVWTHGARDEEEERRRRGAHPERALRPDECRAEVQRVALDVGDVSVFEGDEVLEELDALRDAEAREGDARGGAVQARHVHVRAEEAEAAVGVFVGFHAFEGGEGVVQHAGRRVEHEGLVLGYARGEPAGRGGPFRGEHVVGEGVAEDEVGRRCERFGDRVDLDGEPAGGEVGEFF